MSSDPKRILILGGGFAGVYTARYLEKLLRPEDACITLVNRAPDFVRATSGSNTITSSSRSAVSRTFTACPA
jgi:NADH dehydrogenase FAD-containing subunit